VRVSAFIKAFIFKRDIANSLLKFNAFPSGADYYLSSDSGGNTFSIYFAHFLDSFLHILGPFVPSSPSDPLQANLSTLFPTTTIVNETGPPLSTFVKTTPDHIFIHGPLQSGALASLNWYTTPAPISDTELRWNIVGMKGEIEVLGKPGLGGWWQTLKGQEVVVRIRCVGCETRTVEVNWEDREGDGRGSNTKRTWEAFLGQRREEFADFGDALETHRILERIVERTNA
jgi:predicted dehydrogenase